MAKTTAASTTVERSLRKQLIGQVVSDKMEKTVVVLVENTMIHAKYGKAIRRSKKYKAHDEKNESKVGDKVLIIETRPLSKDKYFRVAEILEKAKKA
jgi:small subunit ribosomal protein S17